MLRIMIFVGLIGVIATGCNNDSKQSGVSAQSTGDSSIVSGKKLNTDILIGQWKLKESKLNGELVSIESCNADDVTTFNEDGTYTHSVNTKCDNEEVDQVGTYEVTERDDKLFLDIITNGLTLTTEIVISNDTLVFMFDTTPEMKFETIMNRM